MDGVKVKGGFLTERLKRVGGNMKGEREEVGLG